MVKEIHARENQDEYTLDPRVSRTGRMASPRLFNWASPYLFQVDKPISISRNTSKDTGYARVRMWTTKFSGGPLVTGSEQVHIYFKEHQQGRWISTCLNHQSMTIYQVVLIKSGQAHIYFKGASPYLFQGASTRTLDTRVSQPAHYDNHSSGPMVIGRSEQVHIYFKEHQQGRWIRACQIRHR